MKKSEVTPGKVYAVKVSGKIVPVRLDSESSYGGWNATNLHTKRGVRIRTAGKLRREYAQSKSQHDFNGNFPNISEVKGLFDVRILTDRALAADGPSVCCLGQRDDLNAGLRGFTMTPWFQSLGELEDFCKRNIERFRAVPEDAPAPDATGWE